MRVERILVLAGVVILVAAGLFFVVESQNGGSPSTRRNPTAVTLPVLGSGVPSGPTTVPAAERGLLAPLAPQSIVAKNGPALLDVTLTWTPPSSDGGGPITGYQVQIFDITQAQPIVSGSQNTACGACTHITLKNLQAGKQYRFAVYAVNSFGAGLPAGSNPVTVVGYPSAPQQISAQPGAAAHTIDVVWYPPENDGGSPILGYLIQAYSVGGSAPQFATSQTACATCNTATFSNVGPGNYQFAVFARTALGYGGPGASDDVQIT